MHRSKTADALFPQIVLETKADVAIICEQYSAKTTGLWVEDDTATAGIWIPPTSKAKHKGYGKGNCYVWVQLEDVTIISCYLTPSDRIADFGEKLVNIEDKIREIGGKFIVAGDFNARGIEWGMSTTNSRGRKILDMAARVGLNIANVGNVPTFRRPGCEGTIPDITLVSEDSANKVKNWRVLEEYTGSDHQYISYTLQMQYTQNTRQRNTNNSTHKWNVKKLNKTILIGEIDRRLSGTRAEDNTSEIVDSTMNAIKLGCSKSMPKRRTTNFSKEAVYWWNNEIAGLRQNCLSMRRRYTRARRRSSADTEAQTYREARKILRNAIFASKRQKWEELRQDINQNPWGLGYKLVMRKLGKRFPAAEMERETMKNIVMSLFPTHEIRNEITNNEKCQFPPFTREELQDAAKNLKNNKAPGPDGIPAEVLKEIASKRPEVLLKMYNKCLEEGRFPKAWKVQQLVLISKGKTDNMAPDSFRPLCLLDTSGKLLERMLKPRLHAAIEAKGGLSERQYGFRPGRSTIGALRDVLSAVEATQNTTHYSRPIVLLATMDVKNAFNSLRWSDVLQSLRERFAVPEYLMQIIKDYLRDRILVYNTTDGPEQHRVTSGAAQGSILGPDLWNVTYDDIFRIEMPTGTFLVGYADDVAAVITARNTEEAERRLRQVMIRTTTWLNTHGLQLAIQKTEVLLLTKKQIPLEIGMRIDDETITTKTSVKYLGIRLDSKLTFSSQIKYTTTKAAKVTAQLSSLMANIGGPLPKKRKLLMEVNNSILLYGCEMWADTLKVKRRAKTLLAVQRTAALRVASAYRTVSGHAILLIAGMIPIDLLALERKKIYDLQRNNAEPSDIDAVRRNTIVQWQERWSAATCGMWTMKLIPNIESWINREYGEVNYYLTQFLTSHGYYKKYLHRMGKCDTPYCLYEDENIIDDAEHTFFICDHWAEDREILQTQIGPFTAGNIIAKMCENEHKWAAVAKYCEQILLRKKRDLDNAIELAQHRDGEQMRNPDAGE